MQKIISNMHSQQLTANCPNPRQTLCWAINELEDLVKLTPTDSNTKALELLKEALSLL